MRFYSTSSRRKASTQHKMPVKGRPRCSVLLRSVCYLTPHLRRNLTNGDENNSVKSRNGIKVTVMYPIRSGSMDQLIERSAVCTSMGIGILKPEPPRSGVRPALRISCTKHAQDQKDFFQAKVLLCRQPRIRIRRQPSRLRIG